MKEHEQALRLAQKVLKHSLSDPETYDLIEVMLADETITKKELYHTAFAQGVVATIAAIQQGRVILPHFSN